MLGVHQKQEFSENSKVLSSKENNSRCHSIWCGDISVVTHIFDILSCAFLRLFAVVELLLKLLNGHLSVLSIVDSLTQGKIFEYFDIAIHESQDHMLDILYKANHWVALFTLYSINYLAFQLCVSQGPTLAFISHYVQTSILCDCLHLVRLSKIYAMDVANAT